MGEAGDRSYGRSWLLPFLWERLAGNNVGEASGYGSRGRGWQSAIPWERLRSAWNLVVGPLKSYKFCFYCGGLVAVLWKMLFSSVILGMQCLFRRAIQLVLVKTFHCRRIVMMSTGPAKYPKTMDKS